MQEEKRVCQNCKTEFTIEPDDFAFYEKIKVPAPTFCPECRGIRRTMFWNAVTLFKKTPAYAKGFGEAGKIIGKVFSTYPDESNIKIYDHDYWWSDNWNVLDYGVDVNFKKPFFEQLKELNFSVPWPSRSIRGFVNSDYCNQASYLKNCYLCFNTNNEENCQYCVGSNYSKDSLDCCWSPKLQLCYQVFECNKLFQCFFCSETKDSRNLWFCDECVNCSDCFGCFNLHNKQYYIFNEPRTKEEYFKEIGKINTGSYKELTELKNKLYELKLKFPRKYYHGTHNVNFSGEYVYRSKNTFNCYEVAECENVCYCQNFAPSVKDSYDYTNWGQNSELVYESCACGDNCQNMKFCFDCWPAMQDCEYCLNCHSCSDCFGCVGLRFKQFCILNKQYTEKEYKELVIKIKQHMMDMPYKDARGLIYKYGEFFPVDFSPLAYNETMALEYYPKTKQEAEKEGYLWRDRTSGEYKITVYAKDLPDDIKDVKDDIVKEVICCESCKNAFKFIAPEIEFYKRFSLPLPRMCFWCRHFERRRKANPMTLWHRKCMKPGCQNEFETSYAPDRPEIIYCESCYQNEVV